MLASTTMNTLKFHGCYRLQPPITNFSRNIHPIFSTTYCKSDLCIFSSASTVSSCPQFPPSKTGRKIRNVKVSEMGAPLWTQKDDEEENMCSSEDLTMNGDVYQKTLRLVECSMFAALGGLVYILSSSLAIENYFGCFFALPIVFSSMMGCCCWQKDYGGNGYASACFGWPDKSNNLLANAWFPWSCHGLFVEVYSWFIFTNIYVGLACLYVVVIFTNILRRSKTSWGVSILVSAVVRAVGAVGYVLMYSFLIRENILALITINIHASATFILSSLGFLAIPSMNVIYTIFGTLLLLNCCFFVFLLHLLYALFFARLGMKASLKLPKWFAKAI